MKKKIIVTAALPYANGPIHLGHLAGAYLPADMYVRYQRLRNRDIVFICGSDEHGVPITITADKEGVTPQVVIDRFHDINKRSFEKFGMSFDIYSRTSIPIHHATAQEFFSEFHNRGLLKEKTSMQFFDPKANMFLPDRYVEGTCPNCGNESARSDECENCGSLYDPSELKNPVSKISGETPVLRESTHWYFPLGEYQKELEEFVKAKSEEYGWKENVLQYVRSWFNDGLQDRAVTRDLDWGVKVPLPDAVGKVLYVWFEAVLGYISATKELFAQKGEPEKWREYWQGEDTKYVAFIGKDNIVFHCVVFPAMLMAWNQKREDKYIMPENVPANEFLNFEGKKFSKSRNWSIDVIDFVNEFPADSLRYTLAANLPEYRDTDFYWKEFQARHNNELADILGNFIHRTFTFVHKNFEGKVPALYDLNERDSDMLNLLESYPEKIAKLFEEYKLKEVTLEVMNLARAGNKYFNDSEPWKSFKTDKERCSTSLNIALQTIYTLAELFAPIIPFSSDAMFNILNSKPCAWDDAGKMNMTEGHVLNTPEVLFKKIEDSVIEAEVAKLGMGQEVKPIEPEKTEAKVAEVKKEEPKKVEAVAEAKELITFDDFLKVELKTAKIVFAENVPNSQKLLRLEVEVGEEKRQIVAGIAQSFKPEDLMGKQVVIVSNLKPAKLMGLKSEGMVLAVIDENGKHHVLNVPNEVKSGTIVK